MTVEALPAFDAAEEDALTGYSDSGLPCVGNLAWGSHSCQFYSTTQELSDTLAHYFAAGLRQNEYCMWVTGDAVGIDEAKSGLRKLIPSLDAYIDRRQIEFCDYRDWYLEDGHFDGNRAFKQWDEKERRALDRGYAGMRASGDMAWLEKKDWADLISYEEAVQQQFRFHRIIGLC